jgi:pyruvate/2-oxoglutarate dehydrogenase complex dihydrolipoamide dehydrogenase (E3) component
MERYNLIVIGGGSGGLTVAVIAAIPGARVALLEKGQMGGDCLNYGCVPSKALLKAAKVAYMIRTAAAYGLTALPPLPPQDLKSVMDYVRSAQLSIAPHDSVERFTSLGVEVIEGSGRVLSPHAVEVTGTGQILWGRHLLLATGSHPKVPAIRGLVDVGFLTNESIFECNILPESLLVVSGGPIGTELGQALARLGSRVTVASSSEHILPREDADVAGAAVVHMHAGELLAELTIAKKYGLSLTKLASTIHVFPTLSEVHRSLGDVYLLQRTTPRLRKFLSPIFAWLRGRIRLKGEGPWLSLTPMD